MLLKMFWVVARRQFWKKTASLLLCHSVTPSEDLVPVLRVWLPFLPSWTFFHPWLQPAAIYIYTPTTSYPVPARTYRNTLHLPLPPDWLVHSVLSIGPHSYINTCSLPPGLHFTFLPETLKMGQTSYPETLVIHQKLTPGNKPKNFKQQTQTYYRSLKAGRWNYTKCG